MGNVASTSITRTTNNGEVSEVLEMTQEQFDKIVLMYGTGKRTEQKIIPYNEALTMAQTAVFPNEELKEENFNRANTDGFEKAVVLLKHWAEMTMREMVKKRNFRIEINYNAEAKKTDFAIYTPIEDGTSHIQQEQSES